MENNYLFVDQDKVCNEDTILLVDYDYLAFVISSAVVKKYIVTVKETNEIKEYNSLDGIFNDFMDDEIDITEEIRPLDDFILEKNIYLWMEKIKDIFKKHKKIVGVIGNGKSFRAEFPLVKEYKGNRKDSIPPEKLMFVKKLLKKKFNGYFLNEDGCLDPLNVVEADDVLAMKGYEGYLNYLEKGYFSYLILTVDKDQRGSPSCVFDIYQIKTEDGKKFRYDKPFIIHESLGNLWTDENKKVQGYGNKWLCYQLLCGDSADNIRPYQDLKDQLCKKPSPTKIKKAIEESNSNKELFSYVVDELNSWVTNKEKVKGKIIYKSWNNKNVSLDILNYANMIFKLVYMKRNSKDTTTLDEFIKKQLELEEKQKCS